MCGCYGSFWLVLLQMVESELAGCGEQTGAAEGCKEIKWIVLSWSSSHRHLRLNGFFCEEMWSPRMQRAHVSGLQNAEEPCLAFPRFDLFLWIPVNCM